MPRTVSDLIRLEHALYPDAESVDVAENGRDENQRDYRGHNEPPMIAIPMERRMFDTSPSPIAGRVILADSVIALDFIMGKMIYILKNLNVYPDVMARVMGMMRELKTDRCVCGQNVKNQECAGRILNLL